MYLHQGGRWLTASDTLKVHFHMVSISLWTRLIETICSACIRYQSPATRKGWGYTGPHRPETWTNSAHSVRTLSRKCSPSSAWPSSTVSTGTMKAGRTHLTAIQRRLDCLDSQGAGLLNKGGALFSEKHLVPVFANNLFANNCTMNESPLVQANSWFDASPTVCLIMPMLANSRGV